ncbi:MAG: hypothetical protein IT330_01115, partial [Anaerolineae bacterium]|nr:hypothetical protein [Anaerolineae bacterium]
MSRLTLFFLGAPRMERDGMEIEVDTRKAVALMAYLAVTRQSHSRGALAALFWPEYDQARAALRRTLSALNKALAGDWLDADRESIGLKESADLWVDVVRFQGLLSECKAQNQPAAAVCPPCLAGLAEAVALYRDDFLAGFTLRDSPGFDDWQLFQTESLRRDLGGALERLARCHSALGDFEEAISYARRWLALDP